MNERYHGRLELTWTNKDQRLLAEDDGSYTWVPPPDYRVAEVRLLHNVTTVGATASDRNRAQDNLLIRGDALYALTSLVELPEFAREYAGRVKLVYLDPPFNTQQSFLHYDDALEHSVWLTMMRDRLLSIKTLLSPEGSIWVHCDDSEMAYLRVAMDEVFGRDNFVASTVWERTDLPQPQAGKFTVRHDYLLVFRKSAAFEPRGSPTSDDAPAFYDRVDEQGRRYCLRTLRKTGPGSTRGDRPTMWFPMEAPDGKQVYPIRADGTEGRWRWGPRRHEEEKSQIDWIKTNGRWEPYSRYYASPEALRPPDTIWPYAETGSNRIAKLEIRRLFPNLTPFATPKPEKLLQRIVHIATDVHDVVLDCFLGSGTTAAVAHKMGRRWIGVEYEKETFETFAVRRLSKVVDGTDVGGITEAVGWEGGGGFRIIDVAPSMFQADSGQVFLSEWATNGQLAEMTTAQLHYEYEYDPPFCGRKGRSRLAVVDGLVNDDVIRLLVTALPDNERLVACGTAIDPAARDALRQLRPGSTVRKIPQSILQEYRLAVRSQQPALAPTPGAPEPVATT